MLPVVFQRFYVGSRTFFHLGWGVSATSPSLTLRVTEGTELRCLSVTRSVSEGDVGITPSRTVKEGAGSNCRFANRRCNDFSKLARRACICGLMHVGTTAFRVRSSTIAIMVVERLRRLEAENVQYGGTTHNG